MYWELWDTEVGALVETFLSADEGLQAVREILAVNRPDFIDDLALAAMYEEDESREVELPPALRGEELRARLAEHTRSAGRPLTHGAMKVRIDDKEALQALSWESLRAYLDRSDDWRYAEDIPGKAAVYQHTDKNGRLREIIVPLRRDLGDYVSRMADAVSTLARVEDRSELDVYDDLSTSPAETARKVHERIRKWMTEEHWSIRDVDDPRSVFNVMATLPSGPDVNIFQYEDHVDRITLSQHLLYPDELRAAFDQLLPGDLLRDLVWNIYRDVSMMGIEFSGFDTPSTEMTLRAYVYFDGLTKDVFIQRALLTVRAVALTIRTLSRALEAQSSSARLDLSRENRVFSREDLRTILRTLPHTDGPLTIAG